MHSCCSSQIATQAGVLNVPQWYESGKIYAEAHPEVPQRESSTSTLTYPCARSVPQEVLYRRVHVH